MTPPGAVWILTIVYGAGVSGDRASTDTLDVAVLGVGDHSGDELRALRSWLSGVDELRGRVRLTPPPPGSGKLGALTDILVVTLGPAGAVVALAGALATWLRHRGTNVRVVVRGQGGRRVEVDVRRARVMDAAEVSTLASELSALLDGRAVEVGGESGAQGRELDTRGGGA